MERKWTVEQKAAIDARDRALLVSAAAGSGKTAVLVERMLSIVLDEKKPVDIDRLLVVTFTKAAASEMKERLLNALEARLDKQPENAYLRKQMTLLHHAQICTIDSFCSYILRNYFYEIDLDPGFRVAEEGELRLLKEDVLEKLLEEKFLEATEEFVNFVEYFATGKQDSNLESLILQLYTFAQSHPNPHKWLEACKEIYRLGSLEEVENSSLGRAFTKQMSDCLKELEESCQRVRTILFAEDGPYFYEKALDAEAVVIKQMLETTHWQEWYEILLSRKSGRLSAPKNVPVSESLKEAAEEEIRSIRSQIKELQEKFFACPPRDILKDFSLCEPIVSTFIELTKEFENRFFEKKKEKNMVDFSDLEHLALKVLVDEEGEPTETALTFREHFAEIMIDEYQDSNLLQECILTAVSKTGGKASKEGNNLFMVGDVKQSIYKFRQACPWLFTEKFHTYTKEESANQVISLHKNFRSRQQVLSSTNEVFAKLMQEQVGEIAYDEDATLYLGAAYEEASKSLENYETEVLHFSTDTMPKGSQRADVIGAEAQMIANRIFELTDKDHGLLIGDKKRPAEYKDIVILLRSRGQWADVFVNTLMDVGIPAYAESTTGFYQTKEIQAILNYLCIMDNERQEIPLAAVLSSIWDFSSLEMATIKEAFLDVPFYEGCRSYAKFGRNVVLREKLVSFYEQLDGFRRLVPYTSIHELLWKLYDETGYYDYASAMPGGTWRRANLDMLVNQALTFEKTSYTGLFQFLRYIERIQKYDVDIGEASGVQESINAVRIMTIHKSKGLEFPIVFLAGLGKQFNDQDERQSVVLHSQSGIGIDAIDLDKRTKSTTAIKEMIKWQNHVENRAEEIRVLYVAMTRAKEKLILTAGHKSNESILEEPDYGKVFTYGQITKATSMWQWLRRIVGCSEEFTCLETTYEKIYELEEDKKEELADDRNGTLLGSFASLGMDCTNQNIDGFKNAETEDCLKVELEHLLERISFVYPNSGKTYNAKVSVSELKKRASHEQDDAFESEKLYREPVVIPYLPKFATQTKETKAVEKGTAYHKLLECMDYQLESNKENIDKLLDSLVSRGIMEPEAASAIDTNQIVTFLQSSIGMRMKRAALEGTLKREQPFVFGIPAREFYEDAKEEERILIQGIIDAYFVEDGQLVIVDYKTDRVSKDTGAQKLLDLYKVQLNYYGRALHQLTQLPVKEAYIYSFALEEEILV